MIPNQTYTSSMPNYYPAAQPTYMPAQTYIPQQPVQQQPQPRMSFLAGKFINTVKDILPSEVPMDGSRSYFPTNDEESIYTKFWTSDGELKTCKYVRVEEGEIIEPKPDILAIINERFDKLEKLVYSKPNNQQNFKHNNQNPKKEVAVA